MLLRKRSNYNYNILTVFDFQNFEHPTRVKNYKRISRMYPDPPRKEEMCRLCMKVQGQPELTLDRTLPESIVPIKNAVKDTFNIDVSFHVVNYASY